MIRASFRLSPSLSRLLCLLLHPLWSPRLDPPRPKATWAAKAGGRCSAMDDGAPVYRARVSSNAAVRGHEALHPPTRAPMPPAPTRPRSPAAKSEGLKAFASWLSSFCPLSCLRGCMGGGQRSTLGSGKSFLSCSKLHGARLRLS